VILIQNDYEFLLGDQPIVTSSGSVSVMFIIRPGENAIDRSIKLMVHVIDMFINQRRELSVKNLKMRIV
jgi:hypothetical protein